MNEPFRMLGLSRNWVYWVLISIGITAEFSRPLRVLAGLTGVRND